MIFFVSVIYQKFKGGPLWNNEQTWIICTYVKFLEKKTVTTEKAATTTTTTTTTTATTTNAKEATEPPVTGPTFGE